jgi:AcrR family transcriptional regulator
VRHEPEAKRWRAGLPVRTTRTRAALYGALLALLEEKPLEHITIREITARAEVGYATFFRHYPDKEALLHDLAERQIEALLALTLPILDRIDRRASVQALCDYIWDHRRLWTALLTGGAAGAMRDEFVRQARRNAEAHDRPGAPVPADLRVVFSVTGALEILAWWLRQPRPMTPERMAEILDRMVVAPTLSWR